MADSAVTRERSVAPKLDNLVDYLSFWASVQPDATFSTFRDIDGREIEAYTYNSFEHRTRHLAEYLSQEAGLARGDRALLIYPPGLQIIAAFVACARLGAIPVPVSPPHADERRCEPQSPRAGCC
jgi:acyl-CoA synthetase (AMP-forming)/AMP-acid ligase II